MPKLLALTLFLLPATILSAEDKAAPAFPEEAGQALPVPENLPTVEDSIPDPVENLGPPALFPFHSGLTSAVSAANETAQIHTIQGLNHLHGGWEFEASRHFAVAMKADPDCLMAHWGMVMALLSPSPETHAARIAAGTRMLALLDQGAGTELERGYAYGLVKFIQEGPKGAAIAFRRVAEKFPGELQSEIFASLFGRTGYDDLGTITPDQETAEKRILALIERAPQSALPINALLSIRADSPDLRPSLPLARKLCQLVPDYPPYHYLLGHYEWRSGEHSKAAAAFNRAATLYLKWMKENHATPSDCPEWLRSESYRVVALASKGDFENALASAGKLASTSIDPTRPLSAGSRQLLWDAKTLPARVLMRRSNKGDPTLALASIPSPDSLEPFRSHSLSYWWIDGLRIALESSRLLEAGEVGKASEAIAALSFHGQTMVKRQATADAVGERPEFIAAFHALEVLAASLRGRLALAGPESGHGSAFNWFRAASDRQKPSSQLSPPLLLTPMPAFLGDYYMARKDSRKALEAFQEALASFPQDQPTLARLAEAEKLVAALPPQPPEPEETAE